MNIFEKLSAFFALAACTVTAEAAEPAGYYSSCENKSGAALLSALCSKVGPHTTVSYDGLWDVYKTSDVRPDGTLWDMYTTKAWSTSFKKCGNYKLIGDCVNREHSMPKSWFNNKSPMNSDAFHVYPTDGKVNGQRSNYPYGECAGGEREPNNGSVQALGRRGTSTYPGYTGTVFEPDDQYKGDFARTYFYMMAAYNDKVASWSSPNLAGNSYPALSSWTVEMMLKWHRNDPVSQKEIDRNEAVYARQKNRNPFIDHPELAEYIWGDKKTSKWTLEASTEPAIVLPANGSTLDLGRTVQGVALEGQFKVQGENLTSDLTLTSSSSDFILSRTTLSASAAMAGATIGVTYTGLTMGESSASVTITSGSLRSVLNLTASTISTLPAGPVSSVSSAAFVATWTYIGDADEAGCYTLDVTTGGASIEGYPRQVSALGRSYVVSGLEPSTEYVYTVSSQNLKSDPVHVTTAAPQPYVAFLYDAGPTLYALAGEATPEAELIVEIENISSPVNVSVKAPFQISTDKASWTTSMNLDPEEDRMYLRALSDTPGRFVTEITATCGEYFNDDAEFEAVFSKPGAAFTEDFEKEGLGKYDSHSYEGKMCLWQFDDAGMWKGDKTHDGSTYAVRMGKSASSQIAMDEDVDTGLGIVTLWTALYGTDADAKYELEYSVDGGQTWKSAGSAEITSTTYTEQTFTVNTTGSARMRIRQTAGKRFMIDDIEATAYTSGCADITEDYHKWDAFARDGRIFIEASEDIHVTVYALDGTTVCDTSMKAGSCSLSVANGLYIVAVDDYARRVLVK